MTRPGLVLLTVLLGCHPGRPARSSVAQEPGAVPGGTVQSVRDDDGLSEIGDSAALPSPGMVAEPDLPSPPPEVERATCAGPIGGSVPLSIETAVEAQGGFDEALAAQDLEGLPSELETTPLGPLHRALLAYMLEIDLDQLPETVPRADMEAAGPLGRAVMGAWAQDRARGNEGVDLVFLRRGLHRYYACDRGFPTTLDGFKVAHRDFTALPSYVVEASMPKDGPRQIWEDHDQGIYVAQTLVDGEVRETEILLGSHRSDGALDFLVYDGAGELMDRSSFVTAARTDITGAAPYACIACHFDRKTFRIDVQFPDL